MKYTTPASRAPGRSSVGMRQAVMAWISLACRGERNSSFGGAADCAALRAWPAAAARAVQCVEIQIALMPLPVRRRKLRRLRSLSIEEEAVRTHQNVGRDRAIVKGKRRMQSTQILHRYGEEQASGL